MDALERFNGWARRAGQEAAPMPDVAGPVMLRLGELSIPRNDPGPWAWAATGVSACAAAACALLAWGTWAELALPWYTWVQDLPSWWVL